MSTPRIDLSGLEEQLDDQALADELRWIENALLFARHERATRAYVHAQLDAHGDGLQDPDERAIQARVAELERRELDRAPRG